MEIHQMLPTFSPGDAIGNEVIEINTTLRKWGYNSQIYAENIHPEMDAKYLEYDNVSSKDNVLIFHLSIGSDVSNYVKQLPDKKNNKVSWNYAWKISLWSQRLYPVFTGTGKKGSQFKSRDNRPGTGKFSIYSARTK